jgi:hypothetical protein
VWPDLRKAAAYPCDEVIEVVEQGHAIKFMVLVRKKRCAEQAGRPGGWPPSLLCHLRSCKLAVLPCLGCFPLREGHSAWR